MGLKVLKPTTPTRRHTVLLDYAEVTAKEPYKALTKKLKYPVVAGWGTVETPIGSFPCLKLVSKSFGEGFIGPIPVLSLTSEIYQWVTPKYQTPVVAFEANEIELNNELYNDTAVYYITNSITSTENFQDIKIKVISNPAKENINLELGKDLTGWANISLLSQDGKVVYNSNQRLK